MEKDNTEKISLQTILKEIGFQEFENEMVFDFGNCKLSAYKGMTRQYYYGYIFHGYWKTNRSFGEIDFHWSLEVESYEEAIAIVAYYLRRAQLEVLPDWLIAGSSLELLLPWRKEIEAFKNIPKTIIEHDWFRFIVKKILLITETTNEEALTIFSFNGKILEIDCNDILIACPAQGEVWGNSVTVKTKSLESLPKRIQKQIYSIYILDERLHIFNRGFEIIK